MRFICCDGMGTVDHLLVNAANSYVLSFIFTIWVFIGR